MIKIDFCAVFWGLKTKHAACILLSVFILLAGCLKSDKSKVLSALEEIHGPDRAGEFFKGMEDQSKGVSPQFFFNGKPIIQKKSTAPTGDKYWSAQAKSMEVELESYRASIKQNGFLDERTFWHIKEASEERLKKKYRTRYQKGERSNDVYATAFLFEYRFKGKRVGTVDVAPKNAKNKYPGSWFFHFDKSMPDNNLSLQTIGIDPKKGRWVQRGRITEFWFGNSASSRVTLFDRGPVIGEVH